MYTRVEHDLSESRCNMKISLIGALISYGEFQDLQKNQLRLLLDSLDVSSFPRAQFWAGNRKLGNILLGKLATLAPPQHVLGMVVLVCLKSMVYYTLGRGLYIVTGWVVVSFMSDIMYNLPWINRFVLAVFLG